MGKKVLIVGGVAGGASAAARLRRLDEQAEIIIFERGEHISFANCGLPYYLGGVITKREKLLVQTPQGMHKRFAIDVRTDSEATHIHLAEKEIEVREKNGRTYRESYDYLILSPGAAPVRPPIPGIEAENVFTVRNIPHIDAIKGFVDELKPAAAVVVGGGFIGLEMAENLHARGIKTTVIEMLDQVLPPLDYEMAALLQRHLRAKGVDVVLKDGVKSFEVDNNKIKSVILQSGRKITADLAVMAVGVKPEVDLARDAGLAIGASGGILVNERLQTSDPSIFAIGDAIEVQDLVTGTGVVIPLAGPANKQGRIVAGIIAGRGGKYQGTQGTAIVRVFDMVAASTGANEKNLKKAGISYEVSYTHSGSHAAYYPGAGTMAMKLIFKPEDGRILGTQVVGSIGVDKRIDVLAAALRRGDTVYDLQELELAYAPPFSAAKDPVNMAGYVAGNIIDGDVAIIHWHQVGKLDFQKSVIIDVRTPAEHLTGHISNSRNIPVDEIRQRLPEFPQDKEIIIYCQVGLRGYLACRILSQHGFERVKNLSGGWRTYQTVMEEQRLLQRGLPVPGDKPPATITVSQPYPVNGQKAATPEAVKLDACGLQCPGPIVQVFQRMKTLPPGAILEVTATDPGFLNDIYSWCESTGHQVLQAGKENEVVRVCIRKGGNGGGDNPNSTGAAPSVVAAACPAAQKTIVVFSGDLDKAIASFIIANGAAAMGAKVTMFFTFWGLNILRREQYIPVRKSLVERMFGLMMPRGSRKLQLSKMNMLGLGARMIRTVMQRKNIASLEDLIGQSRQLGVHLVACAMSMDVMGIKQEELLEGVEPGGVATFLHAAEKSNTTLFI